MTQDYYAAGDFRYLLFRNKDDILMFKLERLPSYAIFAFQTLSVFDIPFKVACKYESYIKWRFLKLSFILHPNSNQVWVSWEQLPVGIDKFLWPYRLTSRDRARSICVEGWRANWKKQIFLFIHYQPDDARGHAMPRLPTVTDICCLFYLFQTIRSTHEYWSTWVNRQGQTYLSISHKHNNKNRKG